MPQEHETDRLRLDYPTLFYHTVAPHSMAMQHMEGIRLQYLTLAQQVLTLCPPNRSRSLALTELEYSLMRAIQSLALTGELWTREPPKLSPPRYRRPEYGPGPRRVDGRRVPFL